MHHPIKEYINDKNNWTNEFELVDWVSHGISVRKNYAMKHFLVKYIHDWLPLGWLVSKYAPHYPASCPSCECEVEDRHHMLRCPKRVSIRNKLRLTLQRFFDHYPTDPVLKFLLLRSVKNSFNDVTNTPSCEAKYNELIQNQTAIGWDQILLGRFAIEWKECAHRYIRSLPKDQRGKNKSGQAWVTQVSKILFNFIYEIWEERNKDRHGRDETERERILIERAIQTTGALYNIRNDVLPRHKELYYVSLETHKEAEKSSRGLEQWVTTWGPVLWDSLEKANKLGIGNENPIDSYFLRDRADSEFENTSEQSENETINDLQTEENFMFNGAQ